MSCRTQRILGRRRGAKWYHAAPLRWAMGPARNRRRLNWQVPITHRGGSAEATWMGRLFVMNSLITNNWQ